MQFNSVNNKRRKFCLCSQQRLDLHMCQDSKSSWAMRHSSSFTLSALSLGIRVSHVQGLCLEAVSPPLSIPLFQLFYLLSPFHKGGHGLVARI